ncbi:MAG: hypothetical protein KBT27_12865, partial [Prevotellaceae bacterium]|nr:hypothetical protein [Candidatus Faecinaster equi]
MKHFNFNQSLRNLVNNLKGLFILSLALATFGVGNAWGACNYTLSAESKNKQETKDGGITFYSCSVSNEYGISNISFTFKLGSAALASTATKVKCDIQYSIDGSNWSSFKTFESDDKINYYADKTYSPSYSISSSDGIFKAKSIRVLTVKNDRKITYNVTACTITMAQTLTPKVSEINIGETYIDGSNSASFDFTYSNMNGQTLTVTSSETCFVPNTNSIGLDCSGGKTITVEYKPTCDNHATSATITLKVGSSITKTVTANASCALNDGEVTWNATDEQKKMKVGVDLDISGFATAKYSDQGTISYSSSDPNTIAVNGTTLTAKKSGTADITATIPKGCKYKEANATTTFTVLSKATPVFTPSWENHSSTKALKVGDKVTLTVENVSDGLTGPFEASATKDSGNDILSFSRKGNLVTIEALNAGTSTATFTQTETTDIFGQTQSYKFSVTKIANTLSVAKDSHTMYVDDNWEDKVTTNSDATINISSDDETVAHYDLGSQTIFAQNTNNQSFTSKEVTITISQAATYKYTAAEKTIKVTINKHIPTFTWSNATLYHNQSYNDFFTTNGTNALTVKSSSDDNVAYLVEGANAQKLNLKTLTKAASTTLTVTQAENYYWAEHTESKTVTPKTVANHVPFTVTKEMYDALNDGTAGAQSWDGGIRLGDLGDGFDWNDKYREFGPFNGIPDKLSCSYSCSDAATGKNFKDIYLRIYQSADGSNWGKPILEKTEKKGSVNNIQLAPTTRYLKFVYSGNFAGYFQNITVTELKTFSTDKSELDFGSTNKKDMPCDPKTFTFNYANVGHKVTLSTSDNHFSVSPTSITNIGGEKYGSQTITVSYRTDEVHSATNAKLTISDELGNTKEVTLKGTTTKKAQTLTWEKPYDDVAEPAIPIGKTITGAATSSSNLDITYESSDETIIEIVNDGKAFKAVKEGSATITAKQVGTDDWEEASISKVFKTTNKIIQVISWNQNFTRLLTTYGDQDLTARV